MRAYDLQSWAGFLTAVVGAGAGLAGLIFVALSINLDRLAARPKLAARAAETLAVLLLAVIGSALSLMPMDRVDVGIVLLAVATPVWVVTLKQQLRQGPDSPDHPHWWFLSRIAVTQCAELPIMALHRTWSTVPDSHPSGDARPRGPESAVLGSSAHSGIASDEDDGGNGKRRHRVAREHQ